MLDTGRQMRSLVGKKSTLQVINYAAIAGSKVRVCWIGEGKTFDLK